MKTDEFDYALPAELIAQHPLPQRDDSRLLVLHRQDGRIEHRRFTDLVEYLNPGDRPASDILILNDSRVYPARLYGRKLTGGRVELLLLEQVGERDWISMVGGKKLLPGTSVAIERRDGGESGVVAEISEVLDGPQRRIRFNRPIDDELCDLGHTPLPPYIHERLDDPERYQTVYARPTGSAAAPTAGLHFSPELLLALKQKGVQLEMATLHVGLDTFKPVQSDIVSEHNIHSEWARLTPQAAKRINEAKLSGGRIVAVGTTAVRLLETAACRSAGLKGSLQMMSQRDAQGETSDICPWQPVAAFEGRTDLFIYPGYVYRAVDILITNFHLPKSSLLMLVSAFAGRELIMTAYAEAVQEKYRFYSFGDAMLIL